MSSPSTPQTLVAVRSIRAFMDVIRKAQVLVAEDELGPGMEALLLQGSGLLDLIDQSLLALSVPRQRWAFDAADLLRDRFDSISDHVRAEARSRARSD